MSEQLIDQFVDRARVAGDKDFFVGELKQIYDQFLKLQDLKISLGGVSGLKDTTNGVKELASQTNVVRNATNEYKNTLQQAEAIMAQHNGSSTELLRNSKLISDAKVKEAQATKESARANLDNAKARDIEAKTAQRISNEKAKTLKGTLTEAKVAAELTNDYLQLSRAYNDAALKAKNYSLQLGHNHPVTQQAIKDAKSMYDILLKVDQAVGQNQRQVGNYKSAFDGLGFSITQVARELPSLSVSPQQFFLAISNNLPMVTDEIARARQEIKALQAEGKSAPSLFSRLTSSIFSWQVGLSIAITLLTAFGKQIGNFISDMFGADEATKKANAAIAKQAEEMKELTESFRDYSQIRDEAVGNTVAEIVKVEALAKAVLDQSKSYKERNNALEQLAKINKNYFGDLTLETASLGALTKIVNEYTDAVVRQAIIKELESDIGKVGAAYYRQLRVVQQAATAQREYNQQLEKTNEEFIKSNAAKGVKSFVIDATGDQVKLNGELKKQEQILAPLSKQFNFLKNELQDLNIESLKFKPLDGDPKKPKKEKQDNTLTERLAALDRQRRAEAEFAKEQLREDIRFQEQRIDNDKLTLAERLTAQDDFTDDKLALLFIENQLELAAVDDKLKAIAEIEKKAFKKRTDEEKKLLIQKDALLEERNSKEVQNLGKENEVFIEGSKKKLELIRASLTAEEKLKLEALDKRLKILDQEEAAELLALNKRFDKGKLAVEDYERKKLGIQEFYDAKRLIQSTTNAKELLIAAVIGGKETEDLEKKLADASLKLDDFVTQRKLDNAKKYRDAQKTFLLEVAEAFQQFAGFQFDKEKNEVQAQIDQLERKKQLDIEVANQTIVNEQEKAAAITTIEARSQAQREALEKRQRDIDVRRARTEKYFALAKIGADTAISVNKITAAAAETRAVYSALGPAGAAIGATLSASLLAQIPFIVATAAVQAAVIAAKPIPQFAEGTDDAPGGLAWVGDGGKKEIIETPKGDRYITPDKPTLVNIPKHSKVLPDANEVLESVKFAAFKNIADVKPQSDDHLNKLLISEYTKQTNKIVTAIDNKPVPKITNKFTGWELGYDNAQRYWTYVHQNTQSH